ncbi:MAG: sensor N-terminal transmembrane domain-containing protein, partial [Sphingobium sp.]
MAPDTDSPRNEPGPRRLGTDRVSLTPRILAVNVFALALLAGGFFYLDSYRTRIVDARLDQSARELALVAMAVGAAPAARPDGRLRGDSRPNESPVRRDCAARRVN